MKTLKSIAAIVLVFAALLGATTTTFAGHGKVYDCETDTFIK